MSEPSLPLSEIQHQLNTGTLTCTQRVRDSLAAIHAQPSIHAFLSVYADEALSRAEAIDKRIRQGKAGKLAGALVGLKDVLAYNDHPLSAASRMLDGFTAPYHATSVERLLREDAIIIGRQNCDEFGMGSSTEHSAFGPTLNPVNPTRTPGGSSGGSAAAVALNQCSVSLGSDTGGSVRQPAAFCGVYGLKPTYGRISRHGLIAYASSFDTVGIIANHPEDLAKILTVVSGKDEFDSTASSREVPDYEKAAQDQAPLRIAVFREILESTAVQKEVGDALRHAVDQLRSSGHRVEVVEFKLLDYILPAYYILATAEASSNLSRYDGVRYGHRSEETGPIEAMFKASRNEGFGAEVKRRILLGTFVLSAGYHDAYYAQAQKVRRLIREETLRLFGEFDMLLLPTTPSTAFPLGAKADPVSMYLADVFSVQANVAGVPAISIPYGKDNEGLPIGLQGIAPDFREDRLIRLARILKVGR